MFLWEVVAQSVLLLTTADQTVALTGQSATAGLGTPIEAVNALPTGQSSTGALTAPTVVVIKVPAGQSATGNFTAPAANVTSNVVLPTQLTTSGLGTLNVVVGQLIVLTGQSSTSGLGTAIDKITTLPAGVSSSSGLGTPVEGTTATPSGVQGTGSVGTPLIKVILFPGGQSATGSVGSVVIPTSSVQDVMLMVGSSTNVFVPLFTPSINDTEVLTGQEALALSGGVIILSTGSADVVLRLGLGTSTIFAPPFAPGATIVTITGQSATGAVGSVTVVTGAVVQVPLVGQVATADAADEVIGVDVTIEPDPMAATGSVGTVTTSGTQNVLQGIASQRAFAQVGVLSWSMLTVPLGRFATGQVGTVTITTGTLVAVSAGGIQATGQVGTPVAKVDDSEILSGRSATCQLGSLTLQGDFGVIPGGVQAVGSVGSPSLAADSKVILVGVSVTCIANNPPVGTLTQWFQPINGGFVAIGQVGTPVIHADWKALLVGVQAQSGRGILTVLPVTPVTLTGQAAVGLVGTVVVKLSPIVALIGQFSTGVVGAVNVTANANVTIAPSGRVATGQVGTVSVVSSPTIVADDNSATGAVGSVVARVDVAPQIFSIVCTSQLGVLAVAIVQNVIGLSAVGQLGSISIQAGTSAGVSLPGFQALAQLGTLLVVVDASRALVGQVATGQLGSLGVTFTGGANLAGVQSNGVIGAVVVHAGWTLALTGQFAQTRLGLVTVAAGQNITPTGLQATGHVGVLSPIFVFPINGVQAQGQIGILGVFNDVGSVTIQPTGFVTVGQIGTLQAVDMVRLDGFFVEGEVGDVTLNIIGTGETLVGIQFADEALCLVGMLLVIIGGAVVPPFEFPPPAAIQEYECDPGQVLVDYGCQIIPSVIQEIAGVACTCLVGLVTPHVPANPCDSIIRERFEFASFVEVDAAWPEVVDSLGSLSTWSINTTTVKEGLKSLQLAVVGNASNGQESVRRRTFTSLDGITANQQYALKQWVWLNEEFGPNTGHDLRFGIRSPGFGEKFVPTPASGSAINAWTELTLLVTANPSAQIIAEIGAFDSSASTHNRVARFDDLRIECVGACIAEMDFTVQANTSNINGLPLVNTGAWDRTDLTIADIPFTSNIAISGGAAIGTGPEDYMHYVVTGGTCLTNDHYAECTGRFGILGQDTWLSVLARHDVSLESGYEVTFFDDGSMILWTIINNGSYYDVAYATVAAVLGHDYTLRIEATGSVDPRIRVFLDGVLKIDWLDEFGAFGIKHLTGFPGLCIGSSGSVSPRITHFKAGPI